MMFSTHGLNIKVCNTNIQGIERACPWADLQLVVDQSEDLHKHIPVRHSNDDLLSFPMLFIF